MFPDRILKDSTGRPSPSTLSSCIYIKQHLLPMLLFFYEGRESVWWLNQAFKLRFIQHASGVRKKVEFIVCVFTNARYKTLKAASCPFPERLSSPTLTLPLRQAKPLLWHATEKEEKNPRVMQTHNNSIHYLRVNSFRKEAYVIYSSMLRRCWERGGGVEVKEKWGVFRDKAGGQLRTNFVSVTNSPKRGGNQ